MIKGIPLNLYDDEVFHAAKRRKIVEWPDPEQFLLNFDKAQAEQQIAEDLNSS